MRLFRYCDMFISFPTVVLLLSWMIGCTFFIPPETAKGFSTDPLATAYGVLTKADDAIEIISTGRVVSNRSLAYPGKDYIVGYRFDGVDIPKGSNIQSAVLYQYCAGYESRPVVLKYVGEAADTSQPFSADVYDLSVRPKTEGHQIETDIWVKQAFHPSPDLREIVQEVIDRPGWAPGNAISLFVVDHGSESKRAVYHFEYMASRAARLEITYVKNVPSPGSDTEAPTVTILSPASGLETSQDRVTLDGIASDNVGVTHVDWRSDRGNSGSAQGTEKWVIEDIPLEPGVNRIKVRAHDAAGNLAEISIEVHYTAVSGDVYEMSLPVEWPDDDCFEKTYNGAVSLRSNVLQIGEGRTGAFRFRSVPILPGASILSARLFFYCLYGENGHVILKYEGEASNASQPFTSEAGDISRRSRTVAHVVETPPPWTANTFNAGAELRDVVQEIVDLPDWHEGDPLTLFVEDYGSGDTRSIASYEKSGAYATFLVIELSGSSGFTVIASAEPAVVDLNEPVYFSSETSDPTAVVSYSWDFQDGQTASEENPVHSFETEGNYSVQLEVLHRDGNLYRDRVDISVRRPTVFEGFGEDTTGGSGHTVHPVKSASEFMTVLNDLKAGGGHAEVKLEGDWHYTAGITLAHLKNLTIDGMGSSVYFEGMTLYVIDCENVILKGLRIRNHQSGDDGIQINSCRDVVVDHCSLSEAGDGNLDITGYSYGASQNITVSYCILANTWKQSLVKYGGTTHITFHHNLFYNGGGRFPSMHEGVFDLRNNVIWRWESYATTLLSGARANIINNYYAIPAESTRGHAAIWYYDDSSKAWIDGNVLPMKETDVSRLGGPLDVPMVITQDAEAAKEQVLEQAGALPRDGYDHEIITTIRNNAFPSPPPYHD